MGFRLKMKKCTKCLEIKPLSDFYKNSKNYDRLHLWCKECAKAYSKEYSKTHKDNRNKAKRAEYFKTRYEKNREIYLLKAKEWAKNNKNTVKAWEKANRERKTKLQAKRALALKQRTPKWLTEGDLIELDWIYNIAHFRSQVEGIKYNVRHIVPLQGKNVSGLHVPWNLEIISKTENVKKSDK